MLKVDGDKAVRRRGHEIELRSNGLGAGPSLRRLARRGRYPRPPPLHLAPNPCDCSWGSRPLLQVAGLTGIAVRSAPGIPWIAPKIERRRGFIARLAPLALSRRSRRSSHRRQDGRDALLVLRRARPCRRRGCGMPLRLIQTNQYLLVACTVADDEAALGDDHGCTSWSAAPRQSLERSSLVRMVTT
jgi:hypothetical protein